MKLHIKTNILINKNYKNFFNEVNKKQFKKMALIVDKKLLKFKYVKSIILLLKKKNKNIQYIFFLMNPSSQHTNIWIKILFFLEKKTEIYLMQ